MYVYKPPPPYPGTKHEHHHQLQPSKLRETTPTPGLSTKPRSSFNTHAEVLNQIAAQLKQSSISPSTAQQGPDLNSIPCASAVLVVSNTDIHMQSQGHNNYTKSHASTPNNSSLMSSQDPTTSSSSIINELNKAMAAQAQANCVQLQDNEKQYVSVPKDKIGVRIDIIKSNNLFQINFHLNLASN